MTDKIREIKKAVLRLMLALAIGVLAGAAPGAVLISHAETETRRLPRNQLPQRRLRKMTVRPLCWHFSEGLFC